MKQKKNIKKIIYFSTIFFTIIYIIYRIFFTLPTNLGFISLLLGILVLFIEIWEAIDFFIYYFNTLKVDRPNLNIPNISNINNYPDIDIFIATLNEDDCLVKNTILGCLNLKYPDKNKLHIYVCDDGNRKSIEELSINLNVNYVTRSTNINAKAGNYNNALKFSNSPYIAFFDADMCPTPDFLELTLPFFIENENKKIGFIQLPQAFKNPDIYQYRFHLENTIPFDQEYFYNCLQISKNATNSTVFCGTNALVSRKALEDVGGFATGTLSEDIATGMLIESKGYTCSAIKNIGAYGLNVNDFSGFIKQRSRWARGCIQMAKKYKIFGNKGLSFKQKLEYFSCVSYWYFGLKRLFFLVTPLLFTLFSITIINCNIKHFLLLWLPNYLLKRFIIDKLEENRRSATWNTIYETILTPFLATETLKETLGFRKNKFDVSPKNLHSSKMSKENFKTLLFHLIFLILNLTGAIICLFRLNTYNLSICLLPLVWTISNTFYLFIATIFDLRYKNYKFKNYAPNKIKKYTKFSIFKIFINKN